MIVGQSGAVSPGENPGGVFEDILAKKKRARISGLFSWSE